MSKKEFSKYGRCPVSSTYYFMSKEAQDQFDAAEPSVKKAAMFLLEATIKKSMEDLRDDFILKKFEELDKEIEQYRDRIAKLELVLGKDL